MFVFVTRSKYQIYSLTHISMSSITCCLNVILVLMYALPSANSNDTCSGMPCEHGSCKNLLNFKLLNGTSVSLCNCDRGWTGPSCSQCVGRVSLTSSSGYITDGSGNYSESWQCAWLIDTGTKDTTIRFHLDTFSTECSWDHVYIHDGDSIYAPLKAVYSGLVQNHRRVLVESGMAYVHFYSDAAYFISGFNISYNFESCALPCSEHGSCLGDVCVCDTGWTGQACDTLMCIDEQCNLDPCRNISDCSCFLDNTSAACVKRRKSGYWTSVFSRPSAVGVTSHKAVIIDSIMYIVGGYSLGIPVPLLQRYAFHSKQWSVIDASMQPASRYLHSAVSYNSSVYVFGGLIGHVITNELWEFIPLISTWQNHTDEKTSSSTGWSTQTWVLPLAVVGHTAHVIRSVMYVIFGYNPQYGHIHYIQEYNFMTKIWSLSLSKHNGAIVPGTLGHSSVYDVNTDLIYVHGGYQAKSGSASPTDQLASFSPKTKAWTLLSGSGSHRYLHSAVIVGGLMLVFGGNTHNDSSSRHKSVCYAADVIAYDLTGSCDRWMHVYVQAQAEAELARYGHSSVLRDNTVYMYGGFSGSVKSDMFVFTPGDCNLHLNESECLASHTGKLCTWSNVSHCQNRVYGDVGKPCEPDVGVRCPLLSTCSDCSASMFDCYWCADTKSCSDEACGAEPAEPVNCPDRQADRCPHLYNCQACQKEENCSWNADDNKCQYVKTLGGGGECPALCSSHSSCDNCTQNRCMWCRNEDRCVEVNSYMASFPYGRCMEWTLDQCSDMSCESFHSCSLCHKSPMCGWCNDGENTGLGKCMIGGDSGPLISNDTEMVVDYGQCPSDLWYFTICPLCQCNGHSTCAEGSSVCTSCENNTIGSQCERCSDGYYGNPANGQTCAFCECNDHADLCSKSNGSCFCSTRGITGDACESCDTKNQYYGNPLVDTCYYNLTTDFQYTFDLSRPTDTYYTRINFMNFPNYNDRDVDFTLNCTTEALLNITVIATSYPETVLTMESFRCSYYHTKFDHKKYHLDEVSNATFLIYIYGFQTPFWLQISFVQIEKFNLVLFVGIFFSCFLSLMLIAAALWKIKQKYDRYQQRQRMFVEMEQMANRPFASISIELEPKIEVIPIGALGIRKDPPEIKRRPKRAPNNKPSPVALQPFKGQKCGVLSLLVRLPTGGEDYTPLSQTGLALASAIVTLAGHARKPSVEHIKGDKSKARKTIPNTTAGAAAAGGGGGGGVPPVHVDNRV